MCSRVVPPIVSVAKATPSLAVMSKPTSSPVSTPSGPTGTSVPAFGGFWMSSRSVVASIANSVVVVAPAKLFA